MLALVSEGPLITPHSTPPARLPQATLPHQIRAREALIRSALPLHPLHRFALLAATAHHLTPYLPGVFSPTCGARVVCGRAADRTRARAC
eukprot:scaffold37946_cov72-Phaeocystis_antarctica.AAC.5